MTIKKLINELKKYPNQDAIVVIKSNAQYPEDETFDVDLDLIECWGTDTDYKVATIFATIKK